jgi:hypothetical protein
MSETPLATVAQLAAFLPLPLADTDPTALLILQTASGMVRDHLEVQGYAVDLNPADVVLFDPIEGVMAQLDGLPINSVALVEYFDTTVTPGVWTTADPTTYTVSKRTGLVSALPWTGVVWPTNPESWRVTYSHGFTTLPNSLLGVVLGVAARAYSSPASIESERIGGYQVKYAMEADGFSPIELAAMARYKAPGVA